VRRLSQPPTLELKENTMQRFKKAAKSFISDELGMETLEYALIAGLIAVVAVFVYTSNWDDALVLRLNEATTAGPDIP
jgi:Flp pilus assembly pilin Flp